MTTFLDPLGNRTQLTQGTATGYTANPLNQYTAVGPKTPTYDANGNLTSDGTISYTYDPENRLTQATTPTGTATHTYDPLGRRLGKTVGATTTRFLYDGDQLLAETNASGAIQAKYVYGAGIDEPLKMVRGSTTSYYHADGLGSVIALTNTSGAVVERYRYDVYGNVQITDAAGTVLTTSALGNRFLFTGREYDQETGLYYYRARYYDPKVGRFLSRDPVGYSAGLNLYSYVDNNPLNFVDPLGLEKNAARLRDWLEKLLGGYYFGTGLGRQALEWYAYQYVTTGNWAWAIPGIFAALWTPETYRATLSTLLSALFISRLIGGGTYNQYYSAGNPNYQSSWMTRGNYRPGTEAQQALKLPAHNPGTAVREIRPHPLEPVAGPRPVAGGTGQEYYRGWRFPKE